MGALKLAVSLLLFACLFKSLPAYCQPNLRITLDERNVPLKKALEDIRQKTGYTYFGESNWTEQSHRVSFSVRKAGLRQVLDSCFKDQPFSYEIIGTAISIQPRPQQDLTVHGTVFNEKKEPLEGVTILVRGEISAAAISDVNGAFTIHTHYADDRLLISSVNYESQELKPEEGKNLIIFLKERVGELSDVVVLHNGYQDIRRKNSTGSFDEVGNRLFNRRVSPNILDHIDGITSSVLFNKNITLGTNQSAITIRGRSTIFANPDPLIVIDNFPYTGDISNINPEDVESVTVLKDAAAASIWGAFSGNGVIVITTKKGKLNQAPKLGFTTSQTIGEKPDLYYQPLLSSPDYVDVQQFLYRKGYYANQLSPFQRGAITPAVEIFDRTAKGSLSPTDSASAINMLKGHDVRQDLAKYFYRHSLNSQYLLSLSGGGSVDQYYFSAGYDRNFSNLVRNEYDRISLMGNNTYILLPGKLEMMTGLAFTSSKTYVNNTGDITVSFPYARLADANGNALPVNYKLRNSYIDTAGGGQLLDWHYRPLDELRYADNVGRLTDYRINVGFRYVVRKGLEVRAYYQYGRGDSIGNNYQSLQTFYTRNYINQFTQLNRGVATYIIPKGGILDEYNNTYTTNYGRLQLNYSDSLFKKGKLNVLGGLEIRDISTDRRQDRLYGYNKEDGASAGVDYLNPYPQYSSGQQLYIPYSNVLVNLAERYLSYYITADYTYQGRYILSGSARRDESNLFGVKSNQKGVPLWSAGGAWWISKENFYGIAWLPDLKLRVTDGFNGNVDRTVSAYTTAIFNQGGNTYGSPSLGIINPANPSLRWERTNIFNMGLDFATRNNRLGGSLEYYIKSGRDLLGYSPLDPTTGNTLFKGNTADMRAHGFDLSFHADNPLGPVHWNSVLLFSYVRDQVTAYKQNIGSVANYFNPTLISPLVGKPLYSVYALRWAGLSPQTGDPQGWQGGHVSTIYASIYNSPDLNDMVYMGPANPPVFGGWRNSFYWRQWGLSFNVLYKMGYVFRRNSINYYGLYSGASKGNADFDKRWQHPGDEKTTNVPSMVYPLNSSDRDIFYQSSTVLIEKGDHIRLQDIQLSYELNRADHHGLPVRMIRLYAYANNIGILWKANHAGIDPDHVQGIPSPRTLAIGIKMEP